jgi:hypothetical protein
MALARTAFGLDAIAVTVTGSTTEEQTVGDSP